MSACCFRKTADRKVGFLASQCSGSGSAAACILESPVRTPQQEDYEEEMRPSSVGGVGEGVRCYRCAGARASFVVLLMEK